MSNEDTAPIDFEAFGKIWAYALYLKKKGQAKKAQQFLKKGKIPDNVVIELNWENATLEFNNLVTISRGDILTPRQVHQMGDFFSSVAKFQPKFLYESTTEASFDVTVNVGKTSGLMVEPQTLRLPNNLNMPNSPFGNVFPLSTDARSIPSARRQQPWKFEAKIELEKNIHAIVIMVVRESHCNGEFQCTARLTGKLAAKISKKKGGVPTMIDAAEFPSIYEVFKQPVMSVKGMNQLEIKRTEKSLDWKVAGNFNFIYGVDSRVEIKDGGPRKD